MADSEIKKLFYMEWNIHMLCYFDFDPLVNVKFFVLNNGVVDIEGRYHFRIHPHSFSERRTDRLSHEALFKLHRIIEKEFYSEESEIIDVFNDTKMISYDENGNELDKFVGMCDDDTCFGRISDILWSLPQAATLPKAGPRSILWEKSIEELSNEGLRFALPTYIPQVDKNNNPWKK